MELVLGSQQNGVMVNRTRAAEALSHLLDKSRWTIIEVEVLVTVATALLFLQLILGTWKRRWHSSFVSGALSVCNAFLLPLVFYTLSIMQSSPAKNSMYPVWGASLLMAASGTTAVSPFDYDEKNNKAQMQLLNGFARYVFYLLMLTLLLSPYSLKESFKPFKHSIERRRSSASTVCIMFLFMGHYITKAMDSIAPFFMKLNLFGRMKKNANGHQNGTDPETMKGDSYPVGCEIGCRPQPKLQKITIDQIWGSCGDSHHGETLEEACLSLALCQSLIRRFMGWSSAKASLPATHDSDFNELLQTEEHYHRAFRIIEVELGFCYDFFFTKYHSINFYRVPNFALFLWRVISATMVLVYIIQDSVTISTPDPIVQVQITRADYIITLALLGTALVVELLQALVYLASDWIKVSLACEYVKHKQNAFLEKLIGFLSRVAILSPRRNRIAQYTVILEDKSLLPVQCAVLFNKSSLPKCNLHPVEISRDIEKAIARSIRTRFGEQNNQLASQVRNSMFEHWALKDHWTLKDHSQVEIMLIWHIATDYCHHLSPSSGDGSNPDRGVAVTLSRYCAYLLAFVPQLLPYHAVDIRDLIDTVKKERDDNLQSSSPLERYQEMNRLGDDPPTVFRKGVKLGKQLEDEDMLDEEQRWKAMADFWAKTIVYIAPSHITAKEHMRQLEKGGEFLTHIWALLSHAGILNLVRDDEEVATPVQPTQETVIQVISDSGPAFPDRLPRQSTFP